MLAQVLTELFARFVLVRLDTKGMEDSTYLNRILWTKHKLQPIHLVRVQRI
jgi:hypothetical protein